MSLDDIKKMEGAWRYKKKRKSELKKKKGNQNKKKKRKKRRRNCLADLKGKRGGAWIIKKNK